MKPSLAELKDALPPSKAGTLFGCDTETRGVDPSLSTFQVQGIGLVDATEGVYIDIPSLNAECEEYLIEWLKTVKLVAFNTKFDAAALAWFTGTWLDWIGCTYHLFKSMSGEGYIGQKWNLEVLQLDFLGWPYTNKDEMEFALKAAGLTKGTMWKLDPETLGAYCIEDAESALQGWLELNKTAEQFNPYMMDYHQRYAMNLIRLLVRNMFYGMQVDVEHLRSYHTQLLQEINNAMEAFLNHPDVAPHVREYENAIHAKWKRSAPARRTKAGKVSKNHIKWQEKEDKLPKFNANSKKQLAWLFYNRVFDVVKENKKQAVIQVGDKQYEVDKTKTGQRSVKKQLLPLFGEPGKLLKKYNELVKREGYVRAVAALTKYRDTVHPEYNSAATITMRLSGGSDDSLR